MYRDHFAHKAVFPVIHILSIGQLLDNLSIAFKDGADGVFLIDHSGQSPDTLKQLIKLARKEGWFERLWIGANFLGVPSHDAFRLAHQLKLNGLWSDNAHVLQSEITINDEYREAFRFGSEPDREPLYFGGVAFKGQPQYEDGAGEARAAVPYVDVVTTSGPGTGRAASIEKLRRLRKAIGDHPLVVASGVTPENVTEQLAYVDAVLVSTGVNREGNFYNLDPEKLQRLAKTVHTYQPPQ